MRDLTKGSIIRLMLLFSLPILLGSLFQQAYNLVDIIIVGKKLGELSLSAQYFLKPRDITTEDFTVNDVRYYADTSKAQKWVFRKRMLEAGCWLCIETIAEKRAVYSFIKWVSGQSSDIYREGGYHQYDGESLPFLITAR